MLQFVGLQRVRHDLATEQQQIMNMKVRYQPITLANTEII